MINQDLYEMIFKRKSFHLFRNVGDKRLSLKEIEDIKKTSTLKVYHYKKRGKRGIMPADKVSYYNQIDMGIFLCFLDLCLEHNGMDFECTHFGDNGSEEEKTIVATYHLAFTLNEGVV